MINFDNAAVDLFLTHSKEYSDMINDTVICESIFLPAEEGFMDKIKKGFKTLYEKFHSLYVSFKKWASSIIDKIRSAFKKDRGSDSKKAKDAMNDIKDTIDKADEVDKKMKETSESDDETVFESDETKRLREEAEYVSQKMKDLKSRVESTYTALPEKTEAGDKDRNRKASYAEYQKTGKEILQKKTREDKNSYIRKSIYPFVDENPFGLINKSSVNRDKTADIIYYAELVRNGHISDTEEKWNISLAMNCIVSLIRAKEYNAAVKSFRYINSKISSQIHKFSASHKKKYERLVKETESRKKQNEESGLPLSAIAGFYFDLFELNPTTTTLSDAIVAYNS